MKMNEFRTKCLYGVGLGPGDPELITLKALRVIRASEVLVAPSSKRVLRILEQILTPEELAQKKVETVSLPMNADSIIIESNYIGAVDIICNQLEESKTVSYLTIGDPTLYSSFTPIRKLVETKGYDTEIINGIPSFLAVAASCNETLIYGKERLEILPSNYSHNTRVYMKNKSSIQDLLSSLEKESSEHPIKVFGATNCGYEDEKRYYNLEELISDPPESYFTTIIVKEIDD